MRLARAPVAQPPPPGAGRRRRHRRRWLVAAALAVLALLNWTTVEGWLRSALDKAKTPVQVLEADGQMRKAEEVLVRQWRDDRTYDVTLAHLAELDPEVEWGEVVHYRICFRGAGAVTSADTATGTRSQLIVRGVDEGTVNGDPGCPRSEHDLGPWDELVG